MEDSFVRETLRKMVHLLGLPLIFGYAVIQIYAGPKLAILFLTAILLILIKIEHIRLELKPTLPRVVSALLRRSEQNNITSSIFFVTAMIIVFASYDFKIALLALYMLIFGDLMSALIGRSCGRHKLFRKKTWEGTAAGLITNLTVGYFVMPDLPIMFISMAITASIVELITNKISDNLTVPLFAGAVGQLIVLYNVLG